MSGFMKSLEVVATGWDKLDINSSTEILNFPQTHNFTTFKIRLKSSSDDWNKGVVTMMK